MDFITPRDAGFQHVCRVKRGELSLPARWDPFVAAFRDRYGFAPLWIEVDRLPTPAAGPRLTIVVERTAQYLRFCPDPYSQDRTEMRALRRLLRSTMPDLSVDEGLLGGLFGGWRERVDVDSLLLVIHDFERLATEAAHHGVTRPEVLEFESALELGGELWRTARYWGPPIVFVHTRAQAAALEGSSARERWGDLWYAAAKRHDEFGYLTRDEVAVSVDSKQTFDEVYRSNWYYYFK